MSQITTTYSMEMIANVLNPWVTIQNGKTVENKEEKGNQYSLLNLVFSQFAPLEKKLESAQSNLAIAIHEKKLEKLKFGATLASELNDDVDTVMKTIQKVIQNCTPMVQNIEKNPHSVNNIAQKNGHAFHLKKKGDAELALRELEIGKNHLETHFLKNTETDQPIFMKLPALNRTYSELISQYNGAQNQSELFN